MGADLDTEYATAGSGAAESIPVQASALRRGQHVLIKDHPCKIVDMSSSKTGKHGHAKIHFVALDIFDGKKYEDICPSTHNMKASFHACVMFIFLGSVAACQYTVIIVEHLVQPEHSQMVVFIRELVLVMYHTFQHVIIHLFMKSSENSAHVYTLLSRLFHCETAVDPKVTVWPDLHGVVAHVTAFCCLKR